MTSQRWLSPDDLEKHPDFKIPKQTQSHMRMQGRIPYSKVGNKFIRYDIHELHKWLEESVVVRASDAVGGSERRFENGRSYTDEDNDAIEPEDI